MKRPNDIKELFLYFIHAREEARERKELMGEHPSSDDPILQKFRFCNVNREHDRVTRWVAANVRSQEESMSHDQLVLNLVASRVFNEPETLKHLIPFQSVDRLRYRVNAVKSKGLTARIFRGAYMMPAHGSGGGGRSAVDYWCDNIAELEGKGIGQQQCLADVAKIIITCKGFGDFLANQVCTDLRYTGAYGEATDWEDFILCGPGTIRGLRRYFCISPFGPYPPPRGKMPWSAALLKLREGINGLVSPTIAEYFCDPNNLSNCFCEFDKFCRAVEIPKDDTRHRVTLRQYNP